MAMVRKAVHVRSHMVPTLAQANGRVKTRGTGFRWAELRCSQCDSLEMRFSFDSTR